jgi:hypothetical protein
MNMTLRFRIEQKRLELAAKAAGITYIMYSPPSFPHPSGLLHRREPSARLSVWNPLQDDGDLLRLAVAVPHVDLHKIIVEACQVGGACARRLWMPLPDQCGRKICRNGRRRHRPRRRRTALRQWTCSRRNRHRKKQPLFSSRPLPLNELYVEAASCWTQGQAQRCRRCVQRGRQRPEEKENRLAVLSSQVQPAQGIRPHMSLPE